VHTPKRDRVDDRIIRQVRGNSGRNHRHAGRRRRLRCTAAVSSTRMPIRSMADAWEPGTVESGTQTTSTVIRMRDG